MKTATKKTSLAIRIAKDVLKQLKAKKLKVTPGTYLYAPFPRELKGKEKEQAKKHIEKIAPKCEVCALGACFLSFIRLENQVKIEDMQHYGRPLEVDQNTIHAKLEDSFGYENLYHIEQVFEHRDKLGTPHKRLQLIMENFVRNNGKLVTEEL